MTSRRCAAVLLATLLWSWGSAQRAGAEGATRLSVGANHTCATTETGGVKCWGDNAGGQLGDGTTTERSTPVDVVGLDGSAAMIAAGQGHTCALTDSGGVRCWGS